MSSQTAGQGLSPADRYADLIDELIPVAGVTPPAGGSGFGRSALKYRGKIFAMLVRGRLVVKLPARLCGSPARTPSQPPPGWLRAGPGWARRAGGRADPGRSP